MEKIRVLLVDDHALFREGLAAVISSQPNMEVVGNANDGLEAVIKAQELKPDLIDGYSNVNHGWFGIHPPDQTDPA